MPVDESLPYRIWFQTKDSALGGNIIDEHPYRFSRIFFPEDACEFWVIGKTGKERHGIHAPMTSEQFRLLACFGTGIFVCGAGILACLFGAHLTAPIILRRPRGHIAAFFAVFVTRRLIIMALIAARIIPLVIISSLVSALVFIALFVRGEACLLAFVGIPVFFAFGETGESLGAAYPDIGRFGIKGSRLGIRDDVGENPDQQNHKPDDEQPHIKSFLYRFFPGFWHMFHE